MAEIEKKTGGKGAETGQVERLRRVFGSLGRAMPENLSHSLDARLAQLPPAGFLAAALACMGVSATLAVGRKRKGWAGFFGMWVPSLLFLSIYSKLVRIEKGGIERKPPTVH